MLHLTPFTFAQFFRQPLKVSHGFLSFAEGGVLSSVEGRRNISREVPAQYMKATSGSRLRLCYANGKNWKMLLVEGFNGRGVGGK